MKPYKPLFALYLVCTLIACADECKPHFKCALLQFTGEGVETNDVEVMAWNRSRWNIVVTAPARIAVDGAGARIRKATEIAKLRQEQGQPRFVTVGIIRQTLALTGSEYYYFNDTEPDPGFEETYSIHRSTVARASKNNIPQESGFLRFVTYLIADTFGLLPESGPVTNWDVAGETVPGELIWTQSPKPELDPAAILSFKPQDPATAGQVISFGKRKSVGECMIFNQLSVNLSYPAPSGDGMVSSPWILITNVENLPGPLPEEKSQIVMANSGKVYDTRQITSVMNKYDLSRGSAIPRADRHDLVLSAKRKAATVSPTIEDSKPSFFWLRAGLILLFCGWLTALAIHKLNKQKRTN